MAENAEKFFPLSEKTDRRVIDEIAKSVRACLGRPTITPKQIRNLAVLLFGIERLPLTTPGLAADLTLSLHTGNDRHDIVVTLRSDSLNLLFGGCVYTEGAGGDSYSEEALYVEAGGFREVNWRAVAKLLQTFASCAADPQIDLDAGCEESDFDWDDEPDETAWERAAEQHKDIDPDDDGLD